LNRVYKKIKTIYKIFELKNIFFRYAGSKNFILKNVNLRINKGEIIGIIGPTGGGKSTLLDLLMGLLEPTEGAIKIDGSILNSSNRNSWQSKIAHVPQNIYLNDASAAENIAFGKSKDSINLSRLKNSAQHAQISEYFESFDEKYDLNIGERGIKLSGGQKQRVGIARAFYKNAEFLIFDEATSALDSLTEKKVMQSIDKHRNKLTIVIVAHRLSTLKNCSAIYEVKQGKVRKKDINNSLFR
jgi:ATP-binding cassette subfamily B protein